MTRGNHSNDTAPLMRIAPGEIHVWRARVSDFAPHARALESLLSQEEHTRANRYSTSQGCNAFIIRRSLRRLLLSSYLGVAPDALVFKDGPHGKPMLEARLNRKARLRFSTSSSGDQILMAFANDREVGVDIEVLRPVTWEQLAPWFLPEWMVTTLTKMNAQDRQNRFFRLWSRMEACVKTSGNGITAKLGTDQAIPPWCAPSAPHEWGMEVRDLHVSPECRAAIAASGSDWHIRMFRIPRTIAYPPERPTRVIAAHN